MRTKVLTALLAVLALALVFGPRADTARAQRARGSNDNSNSSPQKAGQTKHVFVGRGSDTARGSRVTITGDNPLNDYSAYRSGDRFYVVLPRAAAGQVARGGAGRGYTDMQVQQRGDSVVLSYRLQPGAKPRVEQKFNRLDVVFDASEGGQSGTTSNAGQSSAAQNGAQSGAAQNSGNRAGAAGENRNPNSSGQNASQTPPATSANNSAQAGRNNAAAGVRAGQQTAAQQNGGASSAETPPVVVAGPESGGGEQAAQASAPAQTPEATPAVEPQVAQNQPPDTVAPITTANPAPSAQTGVSLGTLVLNNWPVALIIAVFVAGLGLMFAARRTSNVTSDALESSDAATIATLDAAHAARLKEARAELKSAAAELSPAASAPTPAAASALASVPAVVEAGRVSKRKKAKKEKARRRKEEARREEERAVETSLAESSNATSPVESSTAADAALEKTPDEAQEVEGPAVEPVVSEQATPEQAAPQVAAQEVVGPEVSAPTVEAAAAESLPAVVMAAAETVSAAEAEATVSPATEVAPVTESEPAHVAEVEAAESAVAESVLAETEAAAPSTQIAPVAADPDRAQAEARRLLNGESHERAILSTTDSMARQVVAAELLSALAGRNPERRERARAAFVEYGYFDESARDLREAQAPAERAAAARSLALAGGADATQHLVAALTDPSIDVRRAAIEALGSLRDPVAVAPLEALYESEKRHKNRIPDRVIRNAAESCREAAAQPSAPTPAAEAATEIAAVAEPEAATESAIWETPAADSAATEPGAAFEPATVEPTAPVAQAAPEVAAPTVEAAPSASVPAAEITPSEVASVAGIVPVEEPKPVEEVAAAEVEEVVTTDVEPIQAEPAVVEPQFFGEVPGLSEAGLAAEEISAAYTPQVSEAAEAEPQVASETALEHVEAPEEEPEPFALEPYEPPSAGVAGKVTSVAPFEDSAAIEAAPEQAKTEAPASDWFEFDVQEKSFEPKPTPAEPSESVFEASSGEAMPNAAAADFAPTLVEPHAPQAATSTQIEHSAERAGVEEESPAQIPATDEKGVAPFDEFSTVPASIQHRLASRNASERAAAITELSHVDSDEAFHQICAAFDDEMKEVRSAAARALYELRPDRADSFTRALREATPERRRQIGASIASSGLAAESISQLTGESREKTYEAFSLLFLMAKAGEVQPLIRAIESHPNNEVRLAVVKLLALSGQKEILPAFRRLAVRGSLPTEVRSAVMEAIYQISSGTNQPVA